MGNITHLFRSFAFIKQKQQAENGGHFVCRTRCLVLAGASKVGFIFVLFACFLNSFHMLLFTGALVLLHKS